MNSATHTHFSEDQIWEWLEEIADPEIPVLTILDLGIVRSVERTPDQVVITITPTYSGCPAMDIIAMQIRMALLSRGVKHVLVSEQLSPAWTTDWIRPEALIKLKEYGIAPPTRKSHDALALFEEENVNCPRCNSSDTRLISNFGATACKAMYQCNSCHEPFEQFKCH